MHPIWALVHLPETLLVLSMVLTVYFYAYEQGLGTAVYFLIFLLFYQAVAIVSLFVPGIWSAGLPVSKTVEIAGIVFIIGAVAKPLNCLNF